MPNKCLGLPAWISNTQINKHTKRFTLNCKYKWTRCISLHFLLVVVTVKAPEHSHATSSCLFVQGLIHNSSNILAHDLFLRIVHAAGLLHLLNYSTMSIHLSLQLSLVHAWPIQLMGQYLHLILFLAHRQRSPVVQDTS